MTIHCITFDLDDTLWECWPSIKRAEQALFTWLQTHYPRITKRYTPRELYNHRMAYTKNHPELQHNLSQIRKNWLKLLADEMDYNADILCQNGFQVFWKERNKVIILEGVQSLLVNLKKDYILGTITNGNADVRYMKIGHLFDFSIKAEDVGAAKPNSAIFQVALNKANVTAKHMLHIGDDPIGDIQGAQAMGIKTIWVNYTQKNWQQTYQPDAMVHHVANLESTIRCF